MKSYSSSKSDRTKERWVEHSERRFISTCQGLMNESVIAFIQGGKNRRRGKNENEDEKRELVFKEDGQGECCYSDYIRKAIIEC